MEEDLDACRAERHRLKIEMNRLSSSPDQTASHLQLLVLKQELEALIGRMSAAQLVLKNKMARTTEAKRAAGAYAQVPQKSR
ncbi:hypothetical protein [Roseibium sp.]|uniref:hypothetical protein n=1 Tax=Roseibium sp. TaxID=1936156 RepID=UPI003B51DB8D